jgi:AbiV family abortive infection protein
MRKRVYPKSSIDDGIKTTLANANRLLDFAIDLDKQGNRDYSYVFYSFAVEEFGKAVLLKQNKQNSKDPVEDKVAFGEHKDKIGAALKELNNEQIEIPFHKFNDFGELKVDENGNVTVIRPIPAFEEFTTDGKYLNVDNRLDILFVDYINGKWQTWKDKQIPVGSFYGKSLAELKRGIQQWTQANGFHAP